jgi:hypothetical protein
MIKQVDKHLNSETEESINAAIYAEEILTC